MAGVADLRSKQGVCPSICRATAVHVVAAEVHVVGRVCNNEAKKLRRAGHPYQGVLPAVWWMGGKRLLLAVNLVANGQLLATLGATGSQYAAAISRLHALTETMLVVSLPVVGLECSFHFCILVFVLWLVHDRAFGVLRSSGCKVTKIIPFGETFPVFFCTPFLRLATS